MNPQDTQTLVIMAFVLVGVALLMAGISGLQSWKLAHKLAQIESTPTADSDMYEESLRKRNRQQANYIFYLQSRLVDGNVPYKSELIFLDELETHTALDDHYN